MSLTNNSIALIGEVDSGKSTTLGQILLLTNAIRKHKINEVYKSCLDLKKDFEPAFLLDALEHERTAEMTIDTTQVHCKWDGLDLIFYDTPGHLELSSCFIASACNCRLALLVLDSTEPINHDKFRHLNSLIDLGLNHYGIIVTKLNHTSNDIFKKIESSLSNFISLKPLFVCPTNSKVGTGFTIQNNFEWRANSNGVLDEIKKFFEQNTMVHPFRYQFTELNNKHFLEIKSGNIKGYEQSIEIENISYSIKRHILGVYENESWQAPAFFEIEYSQSHKFNTNSVLNLTAKIFWLKNINNLITDLRLRKDDVILRIIKITHVDKNELLFKVGATTFSIGQIFTLINSDNEVIGLCRLINKEIVC